MQEIIDNLEMGRARVEIGWCRNNLSLTQGTMKQYCATGALSKNGNWEGLNHSKIAQQARSYLHKALPEETQIKRDYMSDYSYSQGEVEQDNIAHWNNKPERTQADILALYDKAICMAKCDARREVANKLELVDA